MGINNGTGNYLQLLLPDKLAVLSYLTALPLKLMFRLILLLTLPLPITSLSSSGIKDQLFLLLITVVVLADIFLRLNSGGLVYNANNGKARFSYVNGQVILPSIYGSVITDGNWHHVAATRNGTTGDSKILCGWCLKKYLLLKLFSW